MDKELINITTNEDENIVEFNIVAEDIEQDVPVEEVMEAIEIEESEEFEIDVSESMGWTGGDVTKHYSLSGRDEEDQHPIGAITGLKTELDKIESLQTVYSDKIGVANYYKWNSGSYDVAGYFVSLVPNTDTIAICDGTDIFGVVVDTAGFVGGQGGITLDYVNGITKTYGAPRDNSYGLVVTSGLVDVRCELDVEVGDCIVSNAQGYAAKSKSNYGYKVLARENKYGTEYAVIALGVQADTAHELGQEVNMLDVRLDAAESNILSAVNLANEAYKKSQEATTSSSVSEEAVKGALESILKSEEKIKEFEQAVESASATSAQAKAIAASMKNEAIDKAKEALDDTSKLRDELALMDEGITGIENQITIMVKESSEQDVAIAGIRTEVTDHDAKINNLVSWQGKTNTAITRIEQKADANGAYIQSAVSNMNKYSVGPHSQAYGFTLEQAISILEDGMTYAPTEEVVEEYKYASEAVKLNEWSEIDKDISKVYAVSNNGMITYWYCSGYDIDNEKCIWSNSDSIPTYSRIFQRYYLYQWRRLNEAGPYRWITVDKSYNPLNEVNASSQAVMFKTDGKPSVIDGDSWGYWYTDGDVLSGDATECEPHTLYKWMPYKQTNFDGTVVVDDEGNPVLGYDWFAVATLAGNSSSRMASQLRQDANSISADIVNIRGDIASVSARVTDNASEIENLTLWTTDEDGKMYNLAQIKQSADDAGASAGILVQQNQDGDKVVNSAMIIAAINDDESSVTIDAGHIDLSGYVTVTGLSGEGTTEINGSNIATGMIRSKDYAYESGEYSISGTAIDLDAGIFRSKNFAIDHTGDAYLNGWSIGRKRIRYGNQDNPEYIVGKENSKGKATSVTQVPDTDYYTIKYNYSDVSSAEVGHTYTYNEELYACVESREGADYFAKVNPKIPKYINEYALMSGKIYTVMPEDDKDVWHRVYLTSRGVYFEEFKGDEGDEPEYVRTKRRSWYYIIDNTTSPEETVDKTIFSDRTYIGIDDLEYSFNEDGTCSVISIGAYPGDEVKIPETFKNLDEEKEYTVERISSNAFANCKNIRSITIPETVTSIGAYAFKNCTSLTEVVIPDSVTDIGEGAFYGCSALVSVSIPEGITEIKDKTFYGCSEFTEIKVRYSNFSLRNPIQITIPSNITKIGEYAFYGCKRFGSVEVLDSVESIGEGAFGNCTNLTTIILPFVGESAIRERPFGHIFGTLKYEGGVATRQLCPNVSTNYSVTYYIPEKLQYVSINSKDIPRYAFDSCSSLKEVVIANATSIGDYAFGGCSNLSDVNFGEYCILKTIGRDAFYCCRSLASIEIPDSVTDIGYSAFAFCDSLTSIVIPDSVETIGDNVLGACWVLESVTFPYVWKDYPFGYFFGTSSNSNGVSTNHYGSSHPGSYYIPKTLKEVTITKGKIPKGAFSRCKLLTKATIGDAVTDIGQYAFYECVALAEVVIPDSVTNIDVQAFYGCTNLKKVDISGSTTNLGGGVFYNCTSLTEVNLGEGVEELLSCTSNSSSSDVFGLFENCSSLKNITIPSSVTKIDDQAFENCASLEVVSFAEGSQLTSIGVRAFGHCDSLRDIDIPASVTSIGRGAFSECHSLESMTIPFVGVQLGASGTYRTFGAIFGSNSYDGGYEVNQAGFGFYVPKKLRKVVVTGGEIPGHAFRQCSWITSIKLPSSARSISSEAFYGCYGITNITIPESMETISDRAFTSCGSLIEVCNKSSFSIIAGSSDYGEVALNAKGIIIDESQTAIKYVDDYVFYDDGTDVYFVKYLGDETDITLPVYGGGYEIYQYAFNSSEIEKVTIPDGVTGIGVGAFSNCSRLTSVVIPDSVTYIGKGAFENCTKIETATIPALAASYISTTNLKSVIITSGTSIGEKAFYNCTSLQNISIPDSITNIGNDAFYNCTSLQNISIPDSITNIGNDAFYGCERLTYNQDGQSSNKAYYLGNDSNPYVVFIRPYYTNQTSCEIHSDTKIIYSRAFEQYSSLGSITIPNGVKSIGYRAFYNCYKPLSLTIPDGVISIGEGAFYNCYSLRSVVIPDSVINIGRDAFKYCSDITSATMPALAISYIPKDDLNTATITSGIIGDGAFRDCTNLTNVTLGNSVTEIGQRAFDYCSSLTSIVIPDSVTSIGDFAFYYCIMLTSVTIPGSVTYIGTAAFTLCANLTTLNYNGTIEQWETIRNSSPCGTGSVKYVQCIDGKITL